MIQSINNHPLTDKKISTDRKRRRKQYISCNANKSSKTKSITHVRFQKCYVIFVIRPFSEIIKDSVKEAVHDGQHPREVNLIKYAENDEKQTNRSIKRHPKDKRLNLIAYISDRIDFLSDV